MRSSVLAVASVVAALAIAVSFVVLGGDRPATLPPPETGAAPAPVASEAPPSPPPAAATSAPQPGEPTASPVPEPFSRPALEARLEALLTGPDLALSRATVGVAIRDEQGRVVLDHRADEPLLPASTMKLVTAASAVLTFGLDHRFTTAVGATAPVTRNGTVVGDLVLVGTGDPVLATPLYEQWIYPARPRTELEDLADAVVAAGVERVTGGVVGDGTSFSGPSVASGWPEHYLWELDARHIAGLTVDGGLGYTVDETADPPKVTIEVAEQPAKLTAAVFSRMLRERGVTIERGPEAAAARREIHEPLASVASPPLRDILVHMVRRSDNQVADTLLQATAVARAGTGSWSMGALSARAALAGIDVTAPGIVIADGSGLSRRDRVTAAFLADLDVTMGRSKVAEDWWSLMAVAGQEGTLRRRLRGTLADGRFLGKTGTLDDVKAVAGVVLGPDERRYHLAVVANDAHGADRTVVSVLMDELVLALAEDLHDCRRDRVAPTATATASPRPSPPHVPAYRLTCAAEAGPDAGAGSEAGADAGADADAGTGAATATAP